MTFIEFVNLVEQVLPDYLPKEHGNIQIMTAPTLKTNDQFKMGILIKAPGQEVVSPINLEPLYEMYKEGKSLDDVVKCVVNEYQRAWIKKPVVPVELMDFEKIKDLITFRVVNQQKNKVFLKLCPWRPEEDLARVYQLSVEMADKSIGVIKITNEMASLWGTSVDEIDTIAMENTPKRYPVVLNVLSDSDVISSLAEPPVNYYGGDDIPEGLLITLTNEQHVMGASVMMYPGVLDNIAKQLDSDLFILPSSTEEVFLLRNDGRVSPKKLGEIVREANTTVVSKELVLSNGVYGYQRGDDHARLLPESLPKERDYER